MTSKSGQKVGKTRTPPTRSPPATGGQAAAQDDCATGAQIASISIGGWGVCWKMWGEQRLYRQSQDWTAYRRSIPTGRVIQVIKNSPIGIFTGYIEQVHDSHILNDFAA